MGSSSRSTNAKGNWKKSYQPCQHCEKKGHPPFRCWKRPDAKCCECNQMGHEVVIYTNRKKAADLEEEYLFVIT